MTRLNTDSRHSLFNTYGNALLIHRDYSLDSS
nr:MAG TPA_asm: hypothetical protein [Caudoviricetes sp.]